jgi:hypothetical protein
VSRHRNRVRLAAVAALALVSGAVAVMGTATGAWAATVVPGGRLDTLTASGSTYELTGWAVDLKAPTTSLAVHVYVDGVMAGAFTADGNRPDIATALPAAGAAHGFDVTVTAPTAVGTHIACVYAINTDPAGSNPLLGCLRSTVASSTGALTTAVPGGVFDSLLANGSNWELTGWAVDSKAPTTSLSVDAYVDGVMAGRFAADGTRTDVAAAYPAAGAAHGFDVMVARPTAAGEHIACVYAINTDPAGSNPLLGCKKATIPSPTAVVPGGFFDTLLANGSNWELTGWTIDGKAPTTSLSVDVYVDGVVAGRFTADATRNDVAAVYPAAGAAHGFDVMVARPTVAGEHIACVYAINTDATGSNPLLGCKTATI